jgi:hypothetical protein
VTTGTGEFFGVTGLTVSNKLSQRRQAMREQGQQTSGYGFSIDSPAPGATTGSHMLFTATGSTNLANGEQLDLARLTYNSLGKSFDASSEFISNGVWSATFQMTDPACTGNQSVTLQVRETPGGPVRSVDFTLTN